MQTEPVICTIAHPSRALNLDAQGLLPENVEGTPIKRVDVVAGPHMPAVPPGSLNKIPEIIPPQTQPPYIVEIEAACDECGGSGFDPGGIDPWGPEPCPACRGAGTQKITKNYLAEALRIVGNPECPLAVERAHLVAIVHYCRQAVSAVVSLPEVPERARGRAGIKRSSRHGRVEVARKHEFTQIKRRKTNVDISPQRA
jgi:hypothetical protein